MKLYLAGPMRGYPQFNFPAFHTMTKRLRDVGHEVYSPAEADEEHDPNTSKLSNEEVLAKFAWYMRRDLEAIFNQQAVAVLPGWEKSTGARLEVHCALTCGFPVYDAEALATGYTLPLAIKPEVKFISTEEVPA